MWGPASHLLSSSLYLFLPLSISFSLYLFSPSLTLSPSLYLFFLLSLFLSLLFSLFPSISLSPSPSFSLSLSLSLSLSTFLYLSPLPLFLSLYSLFLPLSISLPLTLPLFFNDYFVQDSIFQGELIQYCYMHLCSARWFDFLLFRQQRNPLPFLICTKSQWNKKPHKVKKITTAQPYTIYMNKNKNKNKNMYFSPTNQNITGNMILASSGIDQR